MSSTASVSHWLAQVKQGEHGGVQPLLERYFQRLVLLARGRLLGRPGLAGYEEDVALSAFNSLCRGAQRGRFPQLDDRDDLWRLLAVLTMRKAIDLLRRQRPEEAAAEPNVAQLQAHEPPPELAVEMADDFQRLLDRLDAAELRTIALEKVEGYTNEEIAQRHGCVVRSVERKLHRIRLLWAEELPA